MHECTLHAPRERGGPRRVAAEDRLNARSIRSLRTLRWKSRKCFRWKRRRETWAPEVIKRRRKLKGIYGDLCVFRYVISSALCIISSRHTFAKRMHSPTLREGTRYRSICLSSSFSLNIQERNATHESIEGSNGRRESIFIILWIVK